MVCSGDVDRERKGNFRFFLNFFSKTLDRQDLMGYNATHISRTAF